MWLDAIARRDRLIGEVHFFLICAQAPGHAAQVLSFVLGVSRAAYRTSRRRGIGICWGHVSSSTGVCRRAVLSAAGTCGGTPSW
jgi:hypothetical protein